MYKHKDTKKINKRKWILLTACMLAAIVSLLAVLGVFSFISDGFGYILDNEDKYQVTCKRIDDEICLKLGEATQTVQVRNCEISLVLCDVNQVDDQRWDVRFHTQIKNRRGFLSGYMLSPYPLFECSTDDVVPFEVYAKLDGEWHKLKLRGLGGGSTQIDKYSFGLGPSIEFSGNLADAELKLVGFYYTEYKRK